MAGDTGKREMAFRIFATTPGIIERQHEETVTQAFNRGFKDDAVAVGYKASRHVRALMVSAADLSFSDSRFV